MCVFVVGKRNEINKRKRFKSSGRRFEDVTKTLKHRVNEVRLCYIYIYICGSKKPRFRSCFKSRAWRSGERAERRKMQFRARLVQCENPTGGGVVLAPNVLLSYERRQHTKSRLPPSYSTCVGCEYRTYSGVGPGPISETYRSRVDRYRAF